MADFNIHMMTPELLARNGTQIPSPLWSFRLGCVFPDLPYLERFTEKMIRHLLGTDLLSDSEWGNLFHTEGILQMVNVYLTMMRERPQSRKRSVVNFLSGIIMHHHIDTNTHPVINIMSRDLSERSENVSEERAHRYIEKVQYIALKITLDGVVSLGTPSFLRQRRVFPLFIPELPVFLNTLDGILKRAYGRSPGIPKMMYWLFSMYYYSLVMASPAAYFDRRVPEKDMDRYNNKEFNQALKRGLSEGSSDISLFLKRLNEGSTEEFSPETLD